MKEIFASEERQKILDEYGIKYCTDQELNFYFRSETEKKIKQSRYWKRI